MNLINVDDDGGQKVDDDVGTKVDDDGGRKVDDDGGRKVVPNESGDVPCQQHSKG